MTLFVVIGALLALLTLVLLTRPLWRRAPAAEPARSKPLLFGVAGFVCAVAVAGYAWLGTPRALNSELIAAAPAGNDGPITPEQIEAMINGLTARLKDKPEDVEGWAMLGRSLMVLGRHEQAVPALQKAVALRGDDAVLLTEYADALAVVNGRKLDGEPSRLVEQALKIDPNNLKALMLAGVHAFQRQDAAQALQHWEKIVQLAPGSELAQQIQSGIDKARAMAGGGVSAAPAASSATTAAATGTSVSGTVTLAPALAAKARPDDTVFVFARAAEGARMPLAILRKQVKDLPLAFTLDDSMAMSPAAKLSSTPRVVVGARVSASGNAMPQAGDLQGFSAPVAPGAAGLAIQIADVVATP
jgi:cytochrome c-type biogenesis protein CcmH